MNLWNLSGFAEGIERWVKTEDPCAELQRSVINAVLSMRTHPFEGEWDGVCYFRALPGCVAENGEMVTCSWTVIPSRDTVVCQTIAQLRPPFLRSSLVDEDDERMPADWP